MTEYSRWVNLTYDWIIFLFHVFSQQSGRYLYFILSEFPFTCPTTFFALHLESGSLALQQFKPCLPPSLPLLATVIWRLISASFFDSIDYSSQIPFTAMLTFLTTSFILLIITKWLHSWCLKSCLQYSSSLNSMPWSSGSLTLDLLVLITVFLHMDIYKLPFFPIF